MKLLYKDPDKGYLNELLWVPKKHINVQGTKAALSFSFSDKKQMRFLALYQETEHHLLIPREFWDPTALQSLPFEIIDYRPKDFSRTSIRSNIVLDAKSPGETTQRDAVRALRESRGGILQLACGKGKTISALELIAQEQVPALVVVDNTQLLEQWLGAANQFLEIPGGIGLIQGDSFDWRKDLVLATYQTLAARAGVFPEEARKWFGVIVWDEAHHMAAPTWAKTADLFPGKRIGLTATPERADGLHVVYDFHLGPVVYKDLTQELKPQIYFYWTGLEVDTSDPSIREKVCDVNGELHISMLSSYFGQWQERLDLILSEVREAATQGRKILVLSYSLDELINLLAKWNGAGNLYTEVPKPTAQEVGEDVEPCALDERTYKRVISKLGEIRRRIQLTPSEKDKHVLRLHLEDLEMQLKAHEVAKKVRLEHDRRQREYLKEILAKPSTAGLMIGAIKPKERQRMLREKQVTFAVMKYGREGLDEPALDTIFVCEPMSQKNALQQLMGRALRKKPGKKTPLVVFFEDNIGPMMGMCRNLRKHLRTWPHEEGGPYEYTLLGHPNKGRKHAQWIE